MQLAPWRQSCLTAAFALWLGACSQTDSTGQETHRHRVVGDDQSVTVRDGGNELHARPFAEQYCEAVGKSAQFRSMSKHRHSRYVYVKDVVFDCVPLTGAQNHVTT